jgi:histidyl-tRNA synthetase
VVERILLAMGEGPELPTAEVFVAAADGQRERALALVVELRREGVAADLDLAGRGMKGQMRQADRLGAARTVIFDDDGSVAVRDMASGEQRDVDVDRIVEEIR